MGKCLVKKLGANMQDESLVKLNKIVIKLTKNVETSSCYITIGYRNGIKVTSTAGVKTGSTTEPVTEIVRNQTGLLGFFVVGEEGNTITIENVYNIIKFTTTNPLQSNITITGYQCWPFGECKMIGLSSDSPNQFISPNDIMDYSDLRYLSGGLYPPNDRVAEFVVKNPKLTYISQLGSNAGTNIQTASYLAPLSYLQYAAIKVGDISDLGISIRSLNVGFTGAVGSIDDFVAKRVSAGQQSGCVWFNYGHVNNKITFGETTLVDYCAANRITSPYVSWSGNTISISGTQPSGYQAPDDVNTIFTNYINEEA